MTITANNISTIDDIVTERLMAAADAYYERDMEYVCIDEAAARGAADDHAIWLSEDASPLHGRVS